MPAYTATVRVRLKEGVLDPEATTTRRALERLDYDVDDLRRADQFELEFDAESVTAAEDAAQEMTERLLANPTIHDYDVSVEERGEA